jgi:hypothetical protein
MDCDCFRSRAGSSFSSFGSFSAMLVWESRPDLLVLEASDFFLSLLAGDFRDGRRSVKDLVASGERARGFGVMS